MRRIRNTVRDQDGAALIIVLLCTAIVFLFITAVLLMVQRGTRMSGIQKRYQSSLDAAEGGVSLSVKFLDDRMLILSDPTVFTAPINYVPAGGTCLEEKLMKPTTIWTVCSAAARNLDPTDTPDISFVVRGSTGSGSTYRVDAKIVDSRQGVSMVPPGNLQVGGVVNSDGAITPVELPYYYYTVEVAGTNLQTGVSARMTYMYAK
ncbi:MAG: hypothetical protein AB1714_06385 [Acidobacteriota bacterium]